MILVFQGWSTLVIYGGNKCTVILMVLCAFTAVVWPKQLMRRRIRICQSLRLIQKRKEKERKKEEKKKQRKEKKEKKKRKKEPTCKSSPSHLHSLWKPGPQGVRHSLRPGIYNLKFVPIHLYHTRSTVVQYSNAHLSTSLLKSVE